MSCVFPRGAVASCEHHKSEGAHTARHLHRQGPETQKHRHRQQLIVSLVSLVKVVEVATEGCLVVSSQASSIVSLLEEVCPNVEVPGDFLALALEPVQSFLSTSVVVDLLEAWVLLNVSNELALVVVDVLDKHLSQVLGACHLLSELLRGKLCLDFLTCLCSHLLFALLTHF